jgi:hypothetical protein
MTSKRNRFNVYSWAILILTAICIKLIALASDKLDYDTHFMMLDTNLPLQQYVQRGGFGKILMAYWWVTTRLLGESLIAHRIIPLLINLWALVAIFQGVRTQWLEIAHMSFVCLCLFSLNAWATVTVEYPVVNYSVEVLLGILLYFIFLDVAFCDMSGSKVLRKLFPIFPLTFFASYTIAIPVCAGVFSIVAWKLLRPSAYQGIGRFFSLWPFAIVASIPLLLWLVMPFKLLGRNLLPHMYPYFFNRSGYRQDNLGLLMFLLSGFKNWVRLVVLPVSNDLFFQFFTLREWPFYLLFLVVGLFTLIFLAKKSLLSPKIVFTILYLSITFSAILFGAVLSMFPYGVVRYTGWIIAPVCALLAYFLSIWIMELDKLFRFGFRSFSQYCLLVICVFAVVTYFQETYKTRISNYQAIALINPKNTDKVLLSTLVFPAICWHYPNYGDKLIDLGFGKLIETDDQVRDSRAYKSFINQVSDRVLKDIKVAAPSRGWVSESHSPWAQAIDLNYRLTGEVSAPSIWVGTYSLK